MSFVNPTHDSELDAENTARAAERSRALNPKENKTVDITQRLQAHIEKLELAGLGFAEREERDMCRDALAELARREHEIGICKDIIQLLSPKLHNATRHTITVEEGFMLREGDSLLIQIIPPKSDKQKE
jgi:hypothetical protein